MDCVTETSICQYRRLPPSAHIAIDRLPYPTQFPGPLSFTMQSIRRAATRASLTNAISAAASVAPKTQSIAFALRSVNAVRCFSVAAPRAFSRSIALYEEEQQQPQQFASGANRPPPSEHCIFVQNYPFKVSRDEIAEAFAKFGEVVGVTQPLRKTFCFVYFKDAESVQEAIREVDGTFWHGRRIAVKETDARPQDGARRTRPERASQDAQDPTDTLYIGNLSFEATDAELNELFGVFQNVKDVRVAVDKMTGWPRGFAHAQFHSVEAAQEARAAIEGKVLRGREVRVNFATSKQNDQDPRNFNNRRARNERTRGAEGDAAQAEEQRKHQTNDWDA
ncbi:hlh transcription factor [Colletotrichum kahawae]|uniref:Hlh transcription factor n=1 Tax=Colletotrichum kahawae TaxID=34407 RepID=A0AAE0D379_COLKA|nr:hlh transcription factor [Colletotrichum kahawae]